MVCLYTFIIFLISPSQPPETNREIAEFMVLDNLELENSNIFWGYAPGPPEDIADLMVVDHRSTDQKLSGAAPPDSQGNC